LVEVLVRGIVNVVGEEKLSVNAAVLGCVYE